MAVPVILLKKNASPYTFNDAFSIVSLLIVVVPVIFNDELVFLIRQNDILAYATND